PGEGRRELEERLPRVERGRDVLALAPAREAQADPQAEEGALLDLAQDDAPARERGLQLGHARAQDPRVEERAQVAARAAAHAGHELRIAGAGAGRDRHERAQPLVERGPSDLVLEHAQDPGALAVRHASVGGVVREPGVAVERAAEVQPALALPEALL